MINNDKEVGVLQSKMCEHGIRSQTCVFCCKYIFIFDFVCCDCFRVWARVSMDFNNIRTDE